MRQPEVRTRSGFGDLGRADFHRIAQVVRRDTGIDLPDGKLALVQSRLLRRLRVLGLSHYAEYCDLIEDAAGGDELATMVSALTTNVTSFFREAHHFDFLGDHLMPCFSGRLRAGDRVRIWSAGCSTGEEPYSIALTVLDRMPDAGRYDMKILATDLDPAVLVAAASGSYDEAAVARVPERLRSAWFVPEEGAPHRVRVAKRARDLVTFRRLNLIDPWPLSRRFDVIMCRNVVIYFRDDTKALVWDRLVRQLTPQGWLVTGHSERLIGPAASCMRLELPTTYRRTGQRDPEERTSACH